MLVSAELPADYVVKAARMAFAPADTLLKPGGKVSLQVMVEGTDVQVKAITTAVTSDLKKSGIKVVDNEPIKVIVRTENGNSVEKVYGGYQFGGGRRPGMTIEEKVQVTEKISRITIESDGRIAWEAALVKLPQFVGKKENQTIGEAVREANTFDLQFLQHVHIPSIVPKPRDISQISTSTWTSSGAKQQQ